MRILHLVGRSHRRGAETVALELAAELDARGHRDRLLAVGPGHLGDRLPDLPVLTGSVRQHPLALLRAAVALRRDLRARPVDVVLAHGGSALQAAVLATWAAAATARLTRRPVRRVPVVYQLILGMPTGERGRLWHTWWRWLLRRTAGAVALTPVLADEIVALGLRAPVWTVPNARRAERFESLDRAVCGRELRAEIGVGPDIGVVGFVGHLVAQKRPDRAVAVLGELARTGVAAHLVVVGDGPLAGDVRRQVHAAGLDDRVTLLGHRTDVERLLAGFDVFVLTSDDEGMPGVVIEALMAGCPVVAFPVGGAAEVLGDSGAGTVLVDHDVAAMAVEVAGLLDDRARLAARSDAARVRSRRFSLEVVAGEYEQLLAEVGSGATPPDR